MPTSPTGRRNKRLKTPRPFTLIEITAVIAVMAIAAGIAVAAFLGESPAQHVERAAAGFETFCARVRYDAMEKSADRMVCFDPESSCFYAADADGETPSTVKDAGLLRWHLPDGIEFDPASDAAGELFRFYASGAASGTKELIFSAGELRRRFRVSCLTGTLRSERINADGEAVSP